MESIQKAQPKEVGGFSSSSYTLAGNDKAFLGQCCQDGKAAKKVKMSLTGQTKLLVGNMNRGSGDKGDRMLRVKGISYKGKKIGLVRGECSKRKGDGGGSGPDSVEGRSLPGGPSKPIRVSVINTPNSPVVYKNMNGGESCDNSTTKEWRVRATVLVEEERAREDEVIQYSEAIEIEIAKDKVRVHNQEVNCRENCVEQCDRGSDDNSSSTAKEVMVLTTVAVEEERATEVEHADAAVKKRRRPAIF
ncbi:hypothetical protein QYF36_018448 [Acer negundo]|nr:hypothetical protein QYF36_018448 [Acer negundo]